MEGRLSSYQASECSPPPCGLLSFLTPFEMAFGERHRPPLRNEGLKGL